MLKNKETTGGAPAALSRRTLLAGAAAGMFAPLVAHAQDNSPVRLVVPFTPGTTPDLCSRLLAPLWQRRFARPFVTDNRPGASGILGMDAVAKAAPDGTTLLFGTSTMLTVPFVYAKVPFDVMSAFAPIGLIGTTNFALVVHPSVPANSAREFVNWVKAQPEPVQYASPGKGTFQHLAMEWIANLAGLKLVHVPYKGSAPALQDVLGGHVKATIVPLHVAAPLAADRRLRIVGATRKERDADFPAVAPLHESGLPGFDTDAWYAVWAPKGLAADQVAKYNEALRVALADAEVQSALHKQGVRPQASTTDELAKRSIDEHAKWGALIKSIKLPQE